MIRPHPSPKGIGPIIQVIVHVAKGNTQAFQRWLDMVWVHIDTWWPKALSQDWGYGDHGINEILAQVQLTIGPLDPIMVISPISKWVTGMNTFESWINLHICFLASGLRQVEASETAPLHPSQEDK